MPPTCRRGGPHRPAEALPGPFAAEFLQGAEAEALTFRTAISGLDRSLASLIAQSPIERWMRELNRRADVGCRWSPEGLDAVLIFAVTALLETRNLPFLESHDAA